MTMVPNIDFESLIVLRETVERRYEDDAEFHYKVDYAYLLTNSLVCEEGHRPLCWLQEDRVKLGIAISLMIEEAGWKVAE